MIYKGSRYTNTELYDRSGTLMFKIRDRYSFNMDDAVIHIFDESSRLDGLAKFYYGDSQLWWVILEANPRYRCELDINYGDEIVIPSYEEVMKCLT